VKAHLLLRGVGGVLRRGWRGVVLQLKIETQFKIYATLNKTLNSTISTPEEDAVLTM